MLLPVNKASSTWKHAFEDPTKSAQNKLKWRH